MTFQEAHKHPFQFEAKFSSINLPFQNFESKMENKMSGCFLSEDVFETFKDIYGPLLQHCGWKEKVCYQETKIDIFSINIFILLAGWDT